MSSGIDYRKKFRGAMLGVAVGDAIGAPLEGSSQVSLEDVEKNVASMERLEFTDDTEMTIGVAESLLRCNGFNGEEMAKTFVANFNPARGYGYTTSLVIQRLKAGDKWDLPAREVMRGEGSYGNGAAMRVAPVGLLYNQDLNKVREVAEASSRITHTHILGVEGAVLQAWGIALATRCGIAEEFSEQGFLGRLIEMERCEEYQKKLKKVEKLLQKQPGQIEIIENLGNGGEAQNSVPTAIFFFHLTPNDFKKTVLNSAALGGDADTIASMAGGLSGAFLGEDAIPKEWLEKLEKREELERLADRLFFMFASELLGGRCEMCMSEEGVQVYRINPEKGDDVSNLILLCPKCREETEELPEEFLKKPKKAGKYRAVYRKSYKKR